MFGQSVTVLRSDSTKHEGKQIIPWAFSLHRYDVNKSGARSSGGATSPVIQQVVGVNQPHLNPERQDSRGLDYKNLAQPRARRRRARAASGSGVLKLCKITQTLYFRVRDLIGIYSQISIYSKRINHYPIVKTGKMESGISIDCHCKNI